MIRLCTILGMAGLALSLISMSVDGPRGYLIPLAIPSSIVVAGGLVAQAIITKKQF
jgi:hypothetical protein